MQFCIKFWEPIKLKYERSVLKVMATIFWDTERMIMVDYPDGRKTIILSSTGQKKTTEASRWHSFSS